MFYNIISLIPHNNLSFGRQKSQSLEGLTTVVVQRSDSEVALHTLFGLYQPSNFHMCLLPVITVTLPSLRLPLTENLGLSLVRWLS